MQTVISWVQILLAALIAVAVLLQVRGTGAQLFGQAESSFRVRRGFEKTLFRGTIALAIVFTVIAVTSVAISNP